MSIVGIESAVYGVEDLALGTQFYENFGLPLRVKEPHQTVFQLEEGSRIILRKIDDPSLPAANFEGSGVRETFWGVDSQTELDAFAADLAKDHELTKDPDGTLHFRTDCGIAMGLRYFQRRKVAYVPDPINAPDNITRLNTLRKWRTRARPKVIVHIVFSVRDPDASWPFFRDRLNFRLSDISKGLGVFGRADGCSQHHTIFFLRCDAFDPKGTPGFDHICYGVEDIDELMTGFNYMERHGWKSLLGVGRHRISSGLFCYLENPCGGRAEYGADIDCLDDNWIPRVWEMNFGAFNWTSRAFEFLPTDVAWDMVMHPDYTPARTAPPEAPVYSEEVLMARVR